MFYLRLRNQEVKPYSVHVALTENSDGTKLYELEYPEQERKISIRFTADFPYSILGWEESHYSGNGNDKKILTTSAKLMKSIKTDYWNKNLNQHKHWREKLDL